MNKLFKYNDQVLTTQIENGNLLFKAQDLANMLDYSSTQMAMKILDDDEKLFNPIDYLGQKRKTWFCTESGFFHLVIRSQKPEAKAIRKWVTSVVLPAIQKGMYGTDSASRKLAHLENARLEMDAKQIKIEKADEVAQKLKSELHQMRIAFNNALRSDRNQLDLFDQDPQSLN